MPIYEYVCEKCGKLTDVFQKVDDPPPGQCEGCDAVGPLTRRMSRTSFVLKGGGWYSDLYGSTKKDSAAKSEPAAASAGSGADASASSTGSSSSTSSGVTGSTSTTSSSSAGGDKK